MRDLFHDMEGRTARATAIGRHLAVTTRGPVLWLTLCGALLVAAILAGTIMMVGEFRERALSNSERELENTVLLLTRHFDQQFEDSETIAADVIAQTAISSIASPEAFRERMSSPRRTRDLELQGRRAVLSRRYLHLRFERRHDQLVETVAGSGRQHFGPSLFQDFQVRPAITIGSERGGSRALSPAI